MREACEVFSFFKSRGFGLISDDQKNMIVINPPPDTKPSVREDIVNKFLDDLLKFLTGCDGGDAGDSVGEAIVRMLESPGHMPQKPE